MGSWGWGPFDNDSALDWCVELEEAPEVEHLDFIRSTLQTALDFRGYLPDDTGQEVLAAATLVALSRSKGSVLYGVEQIPEIVISAASADLGGDIAALALRCLDRIGSDESGWRGLWKSTPEWAHILTMLDDLREALRQEGLLHQR